MREEYKIEELNPRETPYAERAEKRSATETSEALQLFEDQPIRTAWNETEEEWYFSITDVVGILSESKDPQAYWRKLKQRLKEEGNETVTNCHALKLIAADGKNFIFYL